MSGVEAAHRDDGKSLQNINFHIVLVFMARAFLFCFFVFCSSRIICFYIFASSFWVPSTHRKHTRYDGGKREKNYIHAIKRNGIFICVLRAYT